MYHVFAGSMEARRGHRIPCDLGYLIISCRVSAGNLTQVLWKSNKWSQLLSHLSSSGDLKRWVISPAPQVENFNSELTFMTGLFCNTDLKKQTNKEVKSQCDRMVLVLSKALEKPLLNIHHHYQFHTRLLLQFTLFLQKWMGWFFWTEIIRWYIKLSAKVCSGLWLPQARLFHL